MKSYLRSRRHYVNNCSLLAKRNDEELVAPFVKSM